MNIDILADNPSWKYYLAFLIPIGILVALCYWMFRGDFHIIRSTAACFTGSEDSPHAQSEAMLDNSTVLAWAAATGQTTMLANFLNLSRRQQDNRLQAGDITSLVTAIKNGHVDAAQLLIQDPSVDVSTATEDGSTVLHLAAEAGASHLLPLLLERGVNPNIKNHENQAALDIAIVLRHDECAAMLLRAKYNIRSFGDRLLSSLHYAALASDIVTFERLAQNGFSFRGIDEDGASPILYALQYGRLDFFKRALSLCPDIFVTDFRGFSLLHSAVAQGDLVAVTLLLDKGLPVNQCSAGALLTPLLVLPIVTDPHDQSDNEALAKLLLDHGADPNCSDAQGTTLAHYHVRDCEVNVISMLRFLSKNGATFSQQDENGNTPHHIACQVGNAPAMEILMDFPEPLRLRNSLGLTPGESAASAGHVDILSQLLDKHPSHVNLMAKVDDVELWRVGLYRAVNNDDWQKVQQLARVANVDLLTQESAFQMAVMGDAVDVTRHFLSMGCPIQWASTRDGYYNSTLFQKALQGNCRRTVSILLDHDVEVNGTDTSGWTALHSATSAGNFDAVTRLLPRIADQRLRDHMGWSALDFAVWLRNEELRRLLDDGAPYAPPWSKSASIYYPGCEYTTPQDVEEPLELPLR